MEKYKSCLRSTNVTRPGALERSCSRALFLIPAIANTASLQYAYDKGNPSSVQRTNNGKTQAYGFTYDCFGNMLTAKVGSRTLAANVYNNGVDQLVQQTYGNGAKVSFTYDSMGNIATCAAPGKGTVTSCRRVCATIKLLYKSIICFFRK